MEARGESAYRGAQALVTGGLGFIGSNLARRLVELGADVTIVDAMIPGCGANRWNIHDILSKVTVCEVDLRDREAITPLVRDQAYIFNLAGQVSHIDSMARPLDDLAINCRSHLTLLEVCRKENPGARIVYAGTRQQYGRALNLPVDEGHPMNPTDVNGINKMAAEWYHRLYHDVHGMHTCSLRLTNTFGPGQLIRHPRQGFLSVFIRKALDGEIIQVFGDGSQLRDYNYVSDVVTAFLLAAADARTAGRVYNLASHEVLSVKQVAEMLVKSGAGGVEIVPFPDDRKRIDIGSYYGSFEKIRAELGWEPRVTVEDGLERTIRYYREHLEHYL
jgi:nucleoside-diphosphate-sugar epimerase